MKYEPDSSKLLRQTEEWNNYTLWGEPTIQRYTVTCNRANEISCHDRRAYKAKMESININEVYKKQKVNQLSDSNL